MFTLRDRWQWPPLSEVLVLVAILAILVILLMLPIAKVRGDERSTSPRLTVRPRRDVVPPTWNSSPSWANRTHMPTSSSTSRGS